VLRERGELAEQPLGLLRLVRRRQLGHVRAQRDDLAGGHFVAGALHVVVATTRGAVIRNVVERLASKGGPDVGGGSRARVNVGSSAVDRLRPTLGIYRDVNVGRRGDPRTLPTLTALTGGSGSSSMPAGKPPRVASDAMGNLTSAPLPPLRADDHVRGPGHAPLVVVYGDYECPFCAALELRLRELPLRVAFRHFPVRGTHPRALAAACAAEAAGLQGAFWAMHDALFADQGRLEDPHLWARAERLGLDLARFEADRRSEAVAARIAADFRGGVRAGVPTTPSLFHDGVLHAGRPGEAALARLANLAA